MIFFARAAMLSLISFVCSVPALAQIAVYPVIIDLPPTDLQRADFTVENPTTERVFVEVEPARVNAPGNPDEARLVATNPQELGLLTSPPRMVLEAGEKRLVRVAALDPPGEAERVFRVSVKPLVGEITGEQSGLKVLVGYDLLVIQRPSSPTAALDWEDRGSELVIRNVGNSNVQLVNGRACYVGQRADDCASLGSERLYANNKVTITKELGQIVSYTLIFMGKSQQKIFK